MRTLSILLACIGGCCGIIAALNWFWATRVEARELKRHEVPHDATFRELKMSGLPQAIEEAGRLNMIAAAWTAATVLFTTSASVVGALALPH